MWHILYAVIMTRGLKYLSDARFVRLGLAIGLATLAFSFWGYLWYATFFDDVWQELIGQSEKGLIDVAAARGGLQTFFTYFISLVQALGLWWLVHLSGKKSFLGYQLVAGICSLMIATPVLGNGVLFANSPLWLWVIDFVHFILGYAGMALTLWLVDEGLPSFYAAREDG